MLKKILVIILLSFCHCIQSNAQYVKLSTNILDWAALGSTNLSLGVGVSRHISVEIGGIYNPFTFKKKSGLIVRNQELTAFAGVKYWPWYIFSGWWFSAKGQYSDFSKTGLWRYALEEGKSVGIGLSAGYTVLLTDKLNLDIGIGAWGGQMIERTLYHCTNCMQLRESGPKPFIAPDNFSLSLMYMF